MKERTSGLFLDMHVDFFLQKLCLLKIPLSKKLLDLVTSPDLNCCREYAPHFKQNINLFKSFFQKILTSL